MYAIYFQKPLLDEVWATVLDKFWDFHIAGPKIEKQILYRCSFFNYFILFHFVASCCCLVLLIFFPLVEMPEGVRPLPNIIWTPFDTNPSPLHEILYVIMLWNLSLSLFGNVFYDLTYSYAVQHTFVQYMLLKELLTNITSDIMTESSDVEKFNSEYFQKTVMSRLKICAEHHSVLLK